MAKFDEMVSKYPNVNKTIAGKFNLADHTPTKKYLEYLFKTWSNRSSQSVNFTSANLIGWVKEFDELNHLIDNKDIYSSVYNQVTHLALVVTRARHLHNEKSFDREKHIRVIKETEDYIFLEPLTLEGSKKYGSGTRWCTASKNDGGTFKRYSTTGFLAYLISKKPNTISSPNYQKIAFYIDESRNLMFGEIQIYNSGDSTVNDSTMVDNGWKWEDIFHLMIEFRALAVNKFRRKKAQQEITTFVNTIKKIDLNHLQSNLKLLTDTPLNQQIVANVEGVMEQLIDKLQKENKFLSTKNE
jgi:hypothetical protein